MTKLFVIGLLWIASLQAMAEESLPKEHAVFPGQQSIQIALHHGQPGEIATNLSIRLVQLTSSTAATVSQVNWETVRLLPGQMVLSTVPLNVPEVRAPVRFLAQAVDAAGKMYGTTHLRAYPRNHLQRLETVVGKGTIGLFDPGAVFTSTLKKSNVTFSVIENAADFAGRFVLIVAQEENAAAKRMAKELSERKIAAIWIRKIGSAADPLIAMPWENSRSVVVLEVPETVALQTAEMQAVLVHLAERMFTHQKDLK